MGIANIRKELNKHDKDGLIDLIEYLYKNDKYAKEYLNFYINPNEAELFLKYKQKVYEAFFPKKGHKIRLAQGKKAIAAFKKFDTAKDLLADLMLCYAETGVVCVNHFGHVSEAFNNSIIGVYRQALTLMQEEHILDDFAERAEKVLNDSEDVGWGLDDELLMIYNEFYG